MSETVVQIRRNLLQRVNDKDQTQCMTEIVFISQFVEYVTGPDGQPAKSFATRTYRFECTPESLEAMVGALQSFKNELDMMDRFATEHRGDG